MMKKINKYITLGIGILVLASCETGALDITENPNALVPEQASVDFFLNSIQEDFIRHIDGDADYDPNDNLSSGGNTNGDGLSNIGLELTRLDNMNGRQYLSAYQGSDFDDEWDNAYRGILADIRSMTPQAETEGKLRHIAIAQFIEAYVIVSLVDFFGNIPYSEALQGLDNLNPVVDDGASVYAAALSLLDQAIVNFQSPITEENEVNVDLLYQTDYDAWIRAVNTLRMKIYLQTRLVDASAIASFNNIVNSGDYITGSDQDFQFNWPATSGTNPDVRHPRYGLNYQATGAGDYLSNWLMNLMDTTNDPRIRYYFYRQTNAVPGATGVPPNEEVLNCSLESAPQHYLDGGFTFCYLDNGYWGRDHGDTDGVPPDGLLRTTYGVYPYGGRFDDDSFEPIAPGDGAGGNGITPILTASLVDFMRAEVAMAEGDVNAAENALVEAVTKSIAKVQSFGSLDPSADQSFAPTALEVSNYINNVQADFNAANMNGKWNILAEQYFIASFGNGIESYNFYRRTGYPTTLQPNLEPDPGQFIRSLFYPSNTVNTNSNMTQKPDQTQPVFWDNHPSGPVAN